MNQREKILAIGVGATIGLFGLQYGYSSLRNSLNNKQALVESARTEADNLQTRIRSGIVAQRKINELKVKSLPTTPQLLIAEYGAWLTKLGEEVGLENIKVTKPERPEKALKSFTSYKFSLNGSCRTDQVLDLLTKFYDKNFLHSITKLNLNMTDQANWINIQLDAEATALRIADQKQPPSEEPSGRLAKSAEAYKAVIIGRNPFAPPNLPPKLATSTKQEVKRGDSWSLKLEGNDPENQAVKFELISKEFPPGMRFNSSGSELSWNPSENGEYELMVRATDSGLPAKSSDYTLAFKVVDPPPPPTKVEEPPKFDPATQSRVSAVLGGREGPEAWIRSLTDGKTIELSVGEDFELGTIKAKVVSINVKESFIELETEGRRWTVGMDDSLTDAFEKSKLD